MPGQFDSSGDSTLVGNAEKTAGCSPSNMGVLAAHGHISSEYSAKEAAAYFVLIPDCQSVK
jgi:hypothetical protein